MRDRRRVRVCVAILAVLAAALPGAAPARVPPERFPGGSYFVVGCGFSHRNNDDAIVFPGQAGRSHDHTYVGNRTTNASTTAASLLGGPTTCADSGDSSAYWVPTVFEDRQAVRPLAVLVYYVNRTAGDVDPLPPGLKMVAGNAHAHHPQPLGVVSWSCGSAPRAARYSTIPSCAGHQALQLQVRFPNCWNGRTLDSADHKRHMAYTKAGRCPPSHPVAVPTILMIVIYPPVDRRSALIASGRFAAHADFIDGWQQDTFAALVGALNRRY